MPDRYIYYVIFFLVLSIKVKLPAEDAIADSLLQQIRISKSDSSKVLIYQELSRQVYSQSISQSLKYADSSVLIAKRSGDDLGLANGEFYRGYALLEMGQIQEALHAGKRAEQIFTDRNDSLSIARVFNLLGGCYLRLDSIDKALDVLFSAAAISEKAKDFSLVASSYNNIGEIYNYADDRGNARRFYRIALENNARTNEDFNRTIILMNLANMQDSSGLRIELLEEAINIADQNSFFGSLAYSYASLGDVFFEDSNNYTGALKFYRKGLENARRSSDLRMITHNLLYSSACWVQLDQIDSAEVYLAQISPEKLEDTYLREYFYYLALLKKKNGRWNEAFDLLDSSLQMNKNYFNQELADLISGANAKYESKQKEAEITTQKLEIERQRSERNLIIFFGVGFLGLLIITGQYLLSRQSKRRAETELALNIEKERANHLEELTRSKEQIFNNLSHELKTPLTLIMGPLENAAKQIRNVPLKEEVSLALRNSKRLSSLVNEILDLSKMDEGKLILHSGTFELVGFLKRIFYAFSSLAASRYIYLEDNLSGSEGVFITTDREKLEKIINNLVSNAIKFGYSGGTVALHWHRDNITNNILSLSISDDGIGISTADQRRVFDRYFRSKETKDYPGTGIGLSLVKEYCQLLGGDIVLESKLNVGSTFNLRIPVSQMSTELYEPLDEEHSKAPPFLKNLQTEVLIVEDDPHMARYLKKMLSNNHLCTLAFNGKQALDILRTRNFDLIISDLMMPEIDGFTLREQINKDSRLQTTPFIMVTARSLDADKIRALRLGVDDYITKPFLPEELLARVNNLIDNRARRQQIAKTEMVPFEDDIVGRAQDFIEINIDNNLLKVSDLADHLNYSIRQLSRLIKRATGLTPVELILEIRMQRAYSLLSGRRSRTIAEVRSAVGIESASYFTKKFQARFGVRPSQMESYR